MNEDTTRELPGATPFERFVVAEFGALRRENAELRQEVAALRQENSAINARLTSLEEKVDARLRETRPIWEGINARLGAIEVAIDDIRHQMGLLVRDLFSVRARVDKLEDDRRPPIA